MAIITLLSNNETAVTSGNAYCCPTKPQQNCKALVFERGASKWEVLRQMVQSDGMNSWGGAQQREGEQWAWQNMGMAAAIATPTQVKQAKQITLGACPVPKYKGENWEDSLAGKCGAMQMGDAGLWAAVAVGEGMEKSTSRAHSWQVSQSGPRGMSRLVGSSECQREQWQSSDHRETWTEILLILNQSVEDPNKFPIKAYLYSVSIPWQRWWIIPITKRDPDWWVQNLKKHFVTILFLPPLPSQWQG